MIGIIALVVFFVIFGGACLLVIVDNTQALNEEKALRQEVRELYAAEKALGPHPTDAQVAQLQQRIDECSARFDKWESSPFVVDR